MSGWDGHSSGSGPEHEPSEERGQAAWTTGQPDADAEPSWASAETQKARPRLPRPPGEPNRVDRPQPLHSWPPAAPPEGETARPWPPAAPPEDQPERPWPPAAPPEDQTPPSWAPADPPEGQIPPRAASAEASGAQARSLRSSAETQTVHTPHPRVSAEPGTGNAPPAARSAPGGIAGGTPQPLWPAAGARAGSAPPSAWTPAPATPPYASAPAASPYTSPPATPRRGRRALLAVGLTVVLGAGAGVGVRYLGRDGSTGTGAGPAVSVGVTASAAGGTSPKGTTSSPSPAAGYRRVHDPVGYTLDVPQGWTRRQRQGEKAPVVYYDSPDDGRRLQIFALSEDTPAQSLDLAENNPGYGFARQPGYRPLDRAAGPTWSELTYRYDADKGPRRVIDHRFQAGDGTLFAIRASGPENIAPALVREPLTTALASFCGPGQRCA